MQNTVIVLADSRIYAAPDVRTLLENMFTHQPFNFDGSENVQQWMQNIAERVNTNSKTKISTESPEEFYVDCLRFGLWTQVPQGTKVQP